MININIVTYHIHMFIRTLYIHEFLSIPFKHVRFSLTWSNEDFRDLRPYGSNPSMKVTLSLNGDFGETLAPRKNGQFSNFQPYFSIIFCTYPRQFIREIYIYIHIHIQKIYIIYIYILELPPHPATVTTRIITFLIGDPYKPSFVTVTGWGVDLI